MTGIALLFPLAASVVARGAAAGPCGEYDPFDRPFPWSPDAPLIVAADGSGTCTTIQGAIDLLVGPKAGYRSRFTIHVRPGTYREKVRIPAISPPLTLRGLGRPEDVVVVWDDAEYPDGPAGCRGNAWREWDSQTLQVAADDFTAAHVSIWNSACGNQRGRNFAVSVTADRAAFFHVRLLGGQDTFYTGLKRVYVMDSFINGTADFIFGTGSVVFEGCEIQEAELGGYLTAARGRNVSQVDGLRESCDLGWGASCEAFVFNRCRLTTAASIPAGSEQGTFLGRPWHWDWATVVYLNTWMGPHIDASGWDPWGSGCTHADTRCNSVFYGEFNSSGPGSDTSKRVAWSRQLAEAEAGKYAAVKVLRGWQPADPGSGGWHSADPGSGNLAQALVV